MKHILTGLLLASIVLLGSSCASSHPGYMNEPNDYSKYTSLIEALRSVGGVRVTGGNTFVGENNITVYLRGASSSIILNTQPLYVINNVPVGNSYKDANSIINMREVTSIRIITGTHAVTRWGVDGNNGVILIKMREAKDLIKK